MYVYSSRYISHICEKSGSNDNLSKVIEERYHVIRVLFIKVNPAGMFGKEKDISRMEWVNNRGR